MMQPHGSAQLVYPLCASMYTHMHIYMYTCTGSTAEIHMRPESNTTTSKTWMAVGARYHQHDTKKDRATYPWRHLLPPQVVLGHVRLRKDIVPPVLDAAGVVVPVRALIPGLVVDVSPDVGRRRHEHVGSHPCDGACFPLVTTCQLKLLYLLLYFPLPLEKRVYTLLPTNSFESKDMRSGRVKMRKARGPAGQG